jgi:hypothetical protein
MFNTGFAQLLGCEEPVLIARHQKRWPCLEVTPARPVNSPDSLLKQAFIPGKAQELLGKSGPGQWPQAGTGSAAKNNRLHIDKGIRQHSLNSCKMSSGNKYHDVVFLSYYLEAQATALPSFLAPRPAILYIPLVAGDGHPWRKACGFTGPIGLRLNFMILFKELRLWPKPLN